MIVVGSFVFVEREEKHEEEEVEGGFSEEDGELGEPGPAILIEDYDEVYAQEGLLHGESRAEAGTDESPALLVVEDDEEEGAMKSKR